jgi:microcystin-dependent protein
MSAPYVGEIRAFGFNFAPYGWATCDGQLLAISQYSPLFAIIGTFYGGNGTTNFALPNLQGNAPFHWGDGTGLPQYVIGEVVGVPNVTLTQAEMPAHVHVVDATTPGDPSQDTAVPSLNASVGPGGPGNLWDKQTSPPLQPFSPKSIGMSGSSFPHQNMQPFLVINYCIALQGIFPSRN